MGGEAHDHEASSDAENVVHAEMGHEQMNCIEIQTDDHTRATATRGDDARAPDPLSLASMKGLMGPNLFPAQRVSIGGSR